MNKTILNLCSKTKSWSKPYEKTGYSIINITLPDYDILKTEIRIQYGDIIFKGNKELFVDCNHIYGILASPSCTMFSFARTTAKIPRDLRQGMKSVIACLNIIWECRYNNKLTFWCLENPRGYLRQFLGKPVFTFDPCDFGDPYTKKTDLWGYFNIPKRNKVEPEFVYLKSGKRTSKIHYNTFGKPSEERKKLRSIVPRSFAKAFFKANQ